VLSQDGKRFVSVNQNILYYIVLMMLDVADMHTLYFGSSFVCSFSLCKMTVVFLHKWQYSRPIFMPD
jgi:hypothetical protein